MKLLISIFLVFASHFLPAQDKVIDSLQRIVSLQRHDTTEVSALLDLTNEFLRKDLEKAIGFAYRAVTLASEVNDNVRLANGFGYLAVLHQGSGRLDSAHYYLRMIEDLTKAHPSNVKIKITHNRVAGLIYKNQGESRKALPYMEANLELLTAENESRAGQLLNIGNTYNSLGDYSKAVSYHVRSLTLFDKLKHKRGQSFCLQNLGIDFFFLKQFDQARKYYEQSYKLKEELQDKRGTVTSLTGLGDSYRELGRFAVAEKYYFQAIDRAREMKLYLEEARSQFQLGILYERMDNPVKAKENILGSLKLARQAGDSTLSARVSSELNGLSLSEKKDKEIEATFVNNLNTLISSGDRQGEVVGYARLSEYYATKKQFEKAFYYQKKYEQLKDSVEGREVLLQMKHLEEQYKSEKKEKEIELLKKEQDLKNAELSQQRANQTIIWIALISFVAIGLLLINRYRVMNRTKRQLELEHMRQGIARDLHDDMGSTLSSINIMSQLALKENGHAAEQLKKIATHSAVMMENMSDIVWSINPKNDSLGQVVSKMKEFAAEILEPKDITYTFQVEESILNLKLDAEKRKNVFLIFKEAVNNAAKYSEARSMTFQMKRENGTLHFSVGDNGKGFDMKEIIHGNGLRNMAARAQRMKGKLEQTSVPGNGSLISLVVPLT